MAGIFLMILWLVISPGGAAQKNKWQDVSSTKCNFSIEMPGKPKVLEKPIKTELIDLYIISYSLHTDNANYAFTCSIAPSNYDLAVDGLFNGLKYRSEQAGWKLQTSKDIYLAKYKGKEYIFVNKDGVLLLGRTILVGDKTYEISVGTTKENVDSEDIQRYFNSFKLLEDPELADKQLLAMGKQYLTSLVRVAAYNSNGELVEEGNGIVTEQGDVITSGLILKKANSAIVKTLDGKQFSVKSISKEFVEGRLVCLTTDRPIKDVNVLAIQSELPEKDDRLLLLINANENKMATRAVASAATLAETGSVHHIELFYNRGIGDYAEKMTGSPLIDKKGNLVGIIQSANSYPVVGSDSRTFFLNIFSMEFLNATDPAYQELTVAEWSKVEIKREEERIKNHPPQQLVGGVVGGVIGGVAPSSNKKKDENKKDQPVEKK